MSDADEILNDELEKTTEFMTSRLSEIDTLRTENEKLKAEAVKMIAQYTETYYKDTEKLKKRMETMEWAEHYKKYCTAFFYWWYNQGGTNTESGFDDWWEKEGQAISTNKDGE